MGILVLCPAVENFTWCYFIVSLGLDGRDAKDKNNFQLWARDVLVTLQIVG